MQFAFFMVFHSRNNHPNGPLLMWNRTMRSNKTQIQTENSMQFSPRTEFHRYAKINTSTVFFLFPVPSSATRSLSLCCFILVRILNSNGMCAMQTIQNEMLKCDFLVSSHLHVLRLLLPLFHIIKMRISIRKHLLDCAMQTQSNAVIFHEFVFALELIDWTNAPEH